MNIAILSRGPSLYSTQRLLIAGQERGHRMFLIDYADCSLVIEKGHPRVYYKEERLIPLHAIVPRIGDSGTALGVAIIRQFEMMGVKTATPSEALFKSRNKLHSLQLLSAAGLGVPKTIYGHHHHQSDYLIETVGGVPCIVKLMKGTHGQGVMLLRHQSSAESTIETFQKLKEAILVQEFIEEARGEDVRAFVVDGKIVAAMKRKARPGEFRSNLHRGGSSIHIKLTSAEIETALQATAVLGLRVAGVDMLQSSRGPLLLEVNPSPGLEGIETTTKINVAGKIIEMLED